MNNVQCNITMHVCYILQIPECTQAFRPNLDEREYAPYHALPPFLDEDSDVPSLHSDSEPSNNDQQGSNSDIDQSDISDGQQDEESVVDPSDNDGSEHSNNDNIDDGDSIHAPDSENDEMDYFNNDSEEDFDTNSVYSDVMIISDDEIVVVSDDEAVVPVVVPYDNSSDENQDPVIISDDNASGNNDQALGDIICISDLESVDSEIEDNLVQIVQDEFDWLCHDANDSGVSDVEWLY